MPFALITAVACGVRKKLTSYLDASVSEELAMIAAEKMMVS